MQDDCKVTSYCGIRPQNIAPLYYYGVRVISLLMTFKSKLALKLKSMTVAGNISNVCHACHLPVYSQIHSFPLHCTLACYVKHCFDCLGSLEIHTRSRWTEQLVLHCRPGSLSMIWLGIMSPQGKRALHARCPLTVLLASQNESPFSNPQRKYSSKTSQADKQRKRKAYVLGSHGNF